MVYYSIFRGLVQKLVVVRVRSGVSSQIRDFDVWWCSRIVVVSLRSI